MIVPDEGALLMLQIWIDALPPTPFGAYYSTYISDTTPSASDTISAYTISGGQVAITSDLFSTPVMVDGVATSYALVDYEMLPGGFTGTVYGYILWLFGGFKVIQAERFSQQFTNDGSTAKSLRLSGLVFAFWFNNPDPGLYPWDAYRSSLVNTTASTLTINVPSYADGDILVAVVVTNNTLTTTTSTGWDLVQEVSSGAPPRIAILKRDASSEPSSYDFAVGGTASAGIIFTIRNATGVNFWQGYYVDTIGSTDMPLSTTAGYPTSNSKNSLILCVWANEANEAITAPGTMDAIINQDTGPFALLIATEHVANGAVFPTRTATIGTAEPWSCLGISLDKTP